MNPDWEELKVKALFAEHCLEDERRAPAFAQSWAGAHSLLSAQRRRRYWLRGAVAASLAALCLVTWPWANRRQPASPGEASRGAAGSGRPAARAVPWKSALLVSEWRAPTDFLLEPLHRNRTPSARVSALPDSRPASRPDKHQ